MLLLTVAVLDRRSLPLRSLFLMNLRPTALNSLLVVMIVICSCQVWMRCGMEPAGHVEKCKDCESWVPLTAPEDDYKVGKYQAK